MSTGLDVPVVSIIVPTHDRADRLAACLAGGGLLYSGRRRGAPQPGGAKHHPPPLRAGAPAVAGQTINGSAGNPFAEASQLIGGALATPARNGRAGLVFAPSNNLACRADVFALICFDE